MQSQHTVEPLLSEQADHLRWNRKWWLALAVVCLLVPLVLREVMMGDAALHFGEDWTEFFLPYYMVVADFARAGHLFVWDPYNSLGLPAFAEPQIGVFSPVLLAFGLLTGGTVSGATFYCMAMWVLGGISMFFLGRHLRAPVWGVLVASLGYMGCGLYLGHQMHTSHIVSFSFIPLVLWRLDVAICSRRWLPALQSGALLGLSGLAGYPGLTVLTGVYCVGWAIGRALQRGEIAEEDAVANAERPLLRRLGWNLLATAVCGLLCIVTDLPSHLGLLDEGAGFTVRTSAVDREMAISAHYLRPASLGGLVSPYASVVLKHNSPSLYGRRGFVMWSTAYCGIGVLILAAFELICHWRCPWRWLLVAVGAFLFLAAMGPVTPVRGWLYDSFDWSRLIRVACTFRNHLFVTLCVLALLGARTLEGSSASQWARRLSMLRGSAIALALAAVLLFLWSVQRTVWSGERDMGLVHMLLWPAAAGACVLALRRDGGRRWLLGGVFAVLAIADLTMTLQIGRGTLFSIDTADAHAALREHQRARDAAGEVDAVPVNREASYPLNNTCVSGRTPTVGGYATLRSPFLPYRYYDSPAQRETSLRLYGFATGRDRTWFSPAAMSTARNPEVFGAFAETVLRDPQRVPLLVHSREQMLSLPSLAPTSQSLLGNVEAEPLADVHAMEPCSVRVVENAPTHQRFTGTVPGPGYLLVTERWSRSWRGFLNGKQVDVLGGNFLFRAVAVPGGEFDLEFRYDIARVWLLLYASWGVLALVLLATLFYGVRSVLEEAGGMSFDLLKGAPEKTMDSPAQRAAVPQESGPLRAWAVLLIMAAVFAFGLRDIVLGRAVFSYANDWDRYFLPYYMAIADFARAGHLFVWDPYNSLGLPAFAEPQIGVFSPVLLAFGLLTGGTVWGATLYGMSMWALGGVSMFFLGRHLKAPVWGVLVASLGYLGCGFYLGHQMHSSHVVSFSFIPLVLWRLDAAILGRRWLPALQAGALLGLSGLAGYPGLTVLTGVYCVAWAIGRALQRGEIADEDGVEGARRPVLRRLAWNLSAVLVCGAICAVIDLPSHLGLLDEGTGFTVRALAVDRETALTANSLYQEALGGLISPYVSVVLRDNSDALFAGSYFPMRFTAYCGIGVLVLAVFELLCHRRCPWRWLLVGIAIVFFLAAMGPLTPVRGWLYDYLAPSRLIRVVCTFRNYLFVTLCVLALLGSRTLTVSSAAQWRGRLPLLRLVAVVWVVAAIELFRWSTRQCEFTRGIGPGLIHMLLWLVMAGAGVFVARRDGARRLLLGSVFAGIAIVDLALTLETGRDTLFSIRTVSARTEVAKHQQARDAAGPVDVVPFAREASFPEDNICVAGRTPTVGGYTTLKTPFLPYRFESRARHEESLRLYRFAVGQDRVWFSPVATQAVRDHRTFLEFANAVAQQPDRVPLLMHTREQMLSLPPLLTPGSTTNRADGGAIARLQPMVQCGVRVMQNTPTFQRLVGTAPGPGYLLVTERWSRSWRGFLNGKQVDVLGGNFLFRAVAVPGGDFDLEFRYDIARVWLLLYASWGVLALVLLATLFYGVRSTLCRRLVA